MVKGNHAAPRKETNRDIEAVSIRVALGAIAVLALRHLGRILAIPYTSIKVPACATRAEAITFRVCLLLGYDAMFAMFLWSVLDAQPLPAFVFAIGMIQFTPANV